MCPAGINKRSYTTAHKEAQKLVNDTRKTLRYKFLLAMDKSRNFFSLLNITRK